MEGESLSRRRWSFGACTFDEASWSLTVDGRRAPMEAKPLELLRELLVSAGSVVSKDELLDRIWPGVTVVEASLPTAVYKLRTAMCDNRQGAPIIETVPGRGYRIVTPVTVEDVPAPGAELIAAPAPVPGSGQIGRYGWRQMRAVLGVAAIATLLLAAVPLYETIRPARKVFTSQEVSSALRQLDVEAVEDMLAANWDPNSFTGSEGNRALHTLMEICEWDRGHDRRRLLLMARTLIEGGGRLDLRNAWGDTPYSIAAAPRYCGSDHPVTQSLRETCFSGFRPLGERCLATYQLKSDAAQEPVTASAAVR